MNLSRLNKNRLVFLLISFVLVQTVNSKPAATLATKLLAEYRKIESITCEIRKTTTGNDTVRMLSRIHYAKPLLIHVDNISPVKRRIISDGKNLYYYEHGQPRGFSRPIEKLTGPWVKSINNVPATPSDHLMFLAKLPEKTIKTDDSTYTKKAYQTETVYVVLCTDAKSRLIRIEFFKSDKMIHKTAEYNYSQFLKVSDNCWIPQLHKAVMFMPDGAKISETRIIDNLEVNKPVPNNMFNPNIFFEKINFVDDFEKTYR